MTRFTALLVAMLFAIQGHAVGDTITYSWVGRIVPEKVEQDPWNLGALGKPFFISATVSHNSLDVDPEVDGAFFESPEIVFLIDGVAPTSLGNEFGSGGIWFEDFAVRDDITILLNDVRFNGFTEERLITAVALPASAFTLTNILEVPPVFSSSPAIAGFGAGGIDSSYNMITETGVLVTVTPIPEPSSLILALPALFVLGTRLFWRKFVLAR